MERKEQDGSHDYTTEYQFEGIELDGEVMDSLHQKIMFETEEVQDGSVMTRMLVGRHPDMSFYYYSARDESNILHEFIAEHRQAAGVYMDRSLEVKDGKVMAAGGFVSQGDVEINGFLEEFTKGILAATYNDPEEYVQKEAVSAHGFLANQSDIGNEFCFVSEIHVGEPILLA